MDNLAEKTKEELTALLEEIKKELKSRETPKTRIYTHDCYNSSNYHMGKYKH